MHSEAIYCVIAPTGSLWCHNMIEYRTTREFAGIDLQALFRSVNWNNIADYPDKAVTAMANSGLVVSAWDGNRLVGLVNAIDDGVFTAFVDNLLVDPEYQGKGIGRQLLQQIISHYRGKMDVGLVSPKSNSGFYEKAGMQQVNGVRYFEAD